MNLVLIGYRGCGKSSVGRRLAERIGWGFADADAAIAQRAGRTIREIFIDEGEEGFRRREAQTIAELARGRRVVLSLGGGAVLRQDNVAVMKAGGKVVWLTAPATVLWERIHGDAGRSTTRPVRTDSDSPQALQALLAVREPIYARVADWKVETAGRTVDDVAAEIEDLARGAGLLS